MKFKFEGNGVRDSRPTEEVLRERIRDLEKELLDKNLETYFDSNGGAFRPEEKDGRYNFW